MSKRNKGKGPNVPTPAAVENGLIVIPNSPPTVQNGMAEAFGFGAGPGIGGGINPWGFGGAGSSAQPVSDTLTSFENLRWYLVSNFRQLISQLFVEIGLVRTVVCVPVDDGLRGGVMFKSKQIDEQQTKELTLEMDRQDDLNTAGWAAKWNRAYGGGGILILVDDQDPEEPLDLEAIGSDTKVIYRAVDMWELYWDKQNVEGYDAEIQEEEFEHYNYYSKLIHKTRVLPLKGDEAPSFIRPRLRGWGISCVETLIRSMNQYLKATDLGFEVLDEFKLDVYKVKNLVNTLMSPTGTQSVKTRIQLMNWQKNYQNAVVLDSEDEFDHKQLSFAGLAEAMEGIRMQVASDMRIPILKLFGQSVSTGGLGTSSTEEMENYNSMVESEVRHKLKFHILRMAEIRCQQLFGFIPDDLELEFKPLRELSATDQETVKTQKYERLDKAASQGRITNQEYRDACNKGNLFDIQLDTDDDTMSEVDAEMGEVQDQNAAAEEGEGDTDGNPNEQGADAPDSEKMAETKPKIKMRNETVHPYGALEKMIRVFNSAAFDRASYEADGGDDWIAAGRKELFIKENAIDKGLYARCVEEADQINLGWQFAVWLYKKQGGKFE